MCVEIEHFLRVTRAVRDESHKLLLELLGWGQAGAGPASRRCETGSATRFSGVEADTPLSSTLLAEETNLGRTGVGGVTLYQLLLVVPPRSAGNPEQSRLEGALSASLMRQSTRQARRECQ